MQFTHIVFLFLTASLNIPPKDLLGMKFDSQKCFQSYYVPNW